MRRRSVILVALAAGLAGCTAPPPAVPAPSSSLASPPVRPSHVVVVVMENKDQGDVLGNRGAPYFNSLARRYAALANYRGVAHPSLPNYLALVSGSTHGIRSDCTDCRVSGRNLADTIEGSCRSMKNSPT